MKRLLAIALPVGLAVVAAAMLLGAWREKGALADARLERARLQREFAERAGVARSLPAEPLDAWREESAALLRWYLEQQAALRNRFPTAAEALSAGAEREAKDDKARAAAEDFRRYAVERFAILEGARYAPVASALAEGLRLDLVSLQPGPSPEGGGPGLRVDFALWGAPRLLDRQQEKDRAQVRTLVPISLRRLAFRFLDARGAPYGEMTGGGEAYQKLVDPERFVADFPPSILFGTWWVELFPREATTVEIELEVSLRGASGRERPALFVTRLPVEEGWRIPPGSAYKAEVREAPPPAGP